jgi:hypothetical protein
MNIFNSTTGKRMFHHWTALYYSLSSLVICNITTACLAWSSAILLTGLSHFNKTISRTHSHLHFNKIHNIITSSYNTCIFLFGQNCVCDPQKYWMMCKPSTWHIKVYTFCLQHVIKSIFKTSNLFHVTPSVNSAINLPSKLSILWYLKCTRI